MGGESDYSMLIFLGGINTGLEVQAHGFHEAIDGVRVCRRGQPSVLQE